MLLEKIKKYYDKSYDLNCAETILYAASEEFNLNLSKETLKASAAFGGGMGIESVCGAITGALQVIGIMFTENRSHEGTKNKELAQEFFKKFTEKLGTDNCKLLKEKYKNDNDRCIVMVETAGEILENIVKRELNK